MKRIALICGAGYVSGKEIMALELADGLRASGHSVAVATSRWGNGDFADRLTKLGCPYRRLWLGFISATLSLECLRMTAHQMMHWPELVIGYRRYLRETMPEKVVHTNWHHLLLLWPFLRPERDLFWLHEVVPDKPQYRRVFQSLARRLQCFVVVSHAVAKSLQQIGIADDKIRVLHNGMANPAIAVRQRSKACAGLRIGIVGQVGQWKGHEDLLEAFGRIAQQHAVVELHIFGHGSEGFETQLKRRAETLGVANRVIWHGFVADRTEIYSQMDICTVPSRSEDPLPTTAIEAAFFGLPVVAARKGGLPEIVEEGVTGFLVAPGYPEELARRLDTLLGNAELRASMGVSARQRVGSLFSRDRFIADFTQLLHTNAG